jgi:hypothetical protein
MPRDDAASGALVWRAASVSVPRLLQALERTAG